MQRQIHQNIFTCYRYSVKSYLFLSFSHRLECEHFSLPAPDLSVLEAVGADLSEQEQTWALYEEFSSSLDSLSAEDWISFR